jgi:hypothetical protein
MEKIDQWNGKSKVAAALKALDRLEDKLEDLNGRFNNFESRLERLEEIVKIPAEQD